jgi:hypothetical protein
MGMIPVDEIRQHTEQLFPEIMKAATQWKPTVKLAPMKAAYPADRFKFTGTGSDVSKLFWDKKWSMGLPILPPTSERVAEMLKGTTRKPDDVIGIVPPRMGVLTVEMAAVHCVMAGCRPEYMPLVIATMDALLTPEANLRGAFTTTGTTAALIFVDGPIVKEIGLAYGQGSAGKGHLANAAIGYAVNSIIYAVGGSKPPAADKGTLAAPSDFTGWIFGENEDALPKGWNSYSVDRGFKKTDSVVTVMGIYPPIENIDHWSGTPEEQINWWAHLITPVNDLSGPCSPVSIGQPKIIGMGPEHAASLASAGWTKEMFAKAFWEQTRMPLSAWPKGCDKSTLERKLGKSLADDALLPVAQTPDLIQVVIAGGAGKHSHYFGPFPGCYPVSKLIKK